MKVREALEGDGKALARLRWDFRPDDQRKQDWDSFRDAFEAWYAEALSTHRWIATVAESDDSSLIGCMFLQSVGKVPNPGGIERAWGYVTNCYVSPGHRGSGVGRQLLRALISAARDRELEFLIVWPSEEAVSLYERAGFRQVSQVHEGPDDYPPLELVL